MDIVINGSKRNIKKSFSLPGDKSIAHRSLIIGALPKGEYTIKNFPKNLDCLATLECMRKLGVTIEENGDNIRVKSPGGENFKKNPGLIDAKNSGTTARLLTGLLCGCGIEAIIDGDNSLRERPMKRVIEPLRLMGAEVEASEGCLPIKTFAGPALSGIKYIMPVASAQVKSCILLAGLFSDVETTVIEKTSSRDHTERMLKCLGADIKIENNNIAIRKSILESRDICIPGDISSAAFLIACALLSHSVEITIENVLLNSSRRSYLDLLKSMNANLDYEILKKVNGEEVGNIRAGSSSLKGISIASELVPGIIDEIPVLSVLAAFSEGTTKICGVSELKYKESDRINAILSNFNSIGFKAEYSEDNLIIHGSDTFLNKPARIKSYNDHRIALAFMALGARNLSDTVIESYHCSEISFPDSLRYFRELLNINACL